MYVFDFSKGREDILHFVPWYDVGTIKELSHDMTEYFKKYWDSENLLKKEIDSTRSQLMSLEEHFSIIESQQNSYFEIEKLQVEYVTTSNMDEWSFSVKHR